MTITARPTDGNYAERGTRVDLSFKFNLSPNTFRVLGNRRNPHGSITNTITSHNNSSLYGPGVRARMIKFEYKLVSSTNCFAVEIDT